MTDSSTLKNQIKNREGLRKTNTSIIGPSPLLKKQKQEQPKKQKPTKCELCPKEFSLFNREHRCKRCFRATCSDCANENRFIIGYNINPDEKHKVCLICASDSIWSETIRKDNQLKWGQDSKLCHKWLQILGIFKHVTFPNDTYTKEHYILIQSAIDDQYETDLKRADQVTSTQAYMYLSEKLMNPNFIKNTYAHNVSYIETTHYITKETSIEQVQSDVANVLTAFVSRNAEKIGFCEQMISLAIFLLFFCSKAKTYIIMDALYRDIIPSYLWPVNYSVNGQRTFFKNISYYCSLLISELKIETSLMPRLKRFLELEGVNLLQSFFIMKLNFDCNFFMFTEILTSQEKYQTVIKCLFSVISQTKNLETLILLGPDDPILLSEFINNTTRFSLQTSYKKMRFKIKHDQPCNFFLTKSMELQRQTDTFDPQEEIDHLRSEIQIIKSKSKRILLQLTDNDDNTKEEIQLEQILEDLLNKDMVIQCLYEALQQKGAFDVADEEDEDKIEINQHKIQNMIETLTSLQSQLKQLNNLKAAYAQKFESVLSSLSNLKQSNPTNHNQVSKEIANYIRDPALLQEKQNKVKDLEEKNIHLQQEKENKELMLLDLRKQCEFLSSKCDQLKIQGIDQKNQNEENKSYLIMILEEKYFEEKIELENIEKDMLQNQGQNIQKLNQSLQDLIEKNVEQQTNLQTIQEQVDEWKNKASKYGHFEYKEEIGVGLGLGVSQQSTFTLQATNLQVPQTQQSSNLQQVPQVEIVAKSPTKSNFFSQKLKESNIFEQKEQVELELHFETVQSMIGANSMIGSNYFNNLLDNQNILISPSRSQEEDQESDIKKQKKIKDQEELQILAEMQEKLEKQTQEMKHSWDKEKGDNQQQKKDSWDEDEGGNQQQQWDSDEGGNQQQQEDSWDAEDVGNQINKKDFDED